MPKTATWRRCFPLVTLDQVEMTIWLDTLAVCTGVEESVTLIRTLYVPALVGVPLSTPVAVLRLRPAGSPVADQEYGVVPPVAVTGAE